MTNHSVGIEDFAIASSELSESAIRTIEDVPARIRNIAMLRGLGYTYREIGQEIGVSPQAVSLMLSRHKRSFKRLRGAVEFRELSSRAVNALGRHGIRSRDEARAAKVLELLSNARNCGKKTLEEIERWMLESPPANSGGTNGRQGGASCSHADAVSYNGEARPTFKESGLMAAGAVR